MQQTNLEKLWLASLIVVTGTTAANAQNGGCPVGQEGVSQFIAPKESKGIIEVYQESELSLANETINAPGWRFRARTITVAPGAIIPIHSHNDRPETAMMKHGELTVYESGCKIPYTMKEGEIFQSGHGTSHWVVNQSDHYSVMYVVDLVKSDTFPERKANALK
jgi:quercetin dioxygenase-like cupin family protein